MKPLPSSKPGRALLGAVVIAAFVLSIAYISILARALQTPLTPRVSPASIPQLVSHKPFAASVYNSPTPTNTRTSSSWQAAIMSTANSITRAATNSIQASQSAAAKATPKPKKTPTRTRPRTPTRTPTPASILPNGVRYGDRRPNLPSRVVRISSPNIKLNTSVYEVYATKSGVWEVADYAAGHQFNSKNPGEGGNIILAGHNNWRGEVFRYLEFLKPGDEIDVWTLDGKQYKYRVQEIKKLKEKGAPMAQRLANGKVMDPTPFEQLTLITCWPYTTYTHRLIVICTPIK